MIEGLRAQGRTIVLTTQYLEEADRLADRVVVVDRGTVIAQGTVPQLKSQVGGDVVEVVLADPAGTKALAAALRSSKPQVDAARGRLRIPAPKGAQTLAEVVAKIDPKVLEGAEVALRRPTLDDVFLALTGHAAEETPAASAGPGKAKGKPSEVRA